MGVVGIILSAIGIYVVYRMIKTAAQTKMRQVDRRYNEAVATIHGRLKATGELPSKRPSWFQDLKSLAVFGEVVIEGAKRAGVSQERAEAWFNSEGVVDTLLGLAEELESRGASEKAQIAGAGLFATEIVRSQLRQKGM